MLKTKVCLLAYLIYNMVLSAGCSNRPKNNGRQQDKFHLVVLAPGHFHAALVQKSMYRDIDSTVRVFAPEGTEVKAYLDLIRKYNNRTDNPTHWVEKVYTGPDYLQKMLQQGPSKKTIVVLAGNNQKKTDYITKAVNSGMNVLADKPMAITVKGFEELKKDFETARSKNVILYDIMTERYAMTNILQKMLVHLPPVFGKLKKGSLEDPAVVFKSVHHFYKEVSGKPVIRPSWYFDTAQQGEGIVDVSTHLIDLIQWECFPEAIFDYKRDVQMLNARHWATELTPGQFSKVTGADSFPDFLEKDIQKGKLEVYANGEMNYILKGVHTRVGVEWRYAAQDGRGDMYYSAIKGTKASLVIRQDKELGYKEALYIEPVNKDKTWIAALQRGMDEIDSVYPGVSLKPLEGEWEVIIPDKYETGHEQRFSRVVKQYLQYLEKQKMPDWEVSSMLTKYYTTTRALEIALQGS